MSVELTHLLGQLRKAGSPLERLRVAGRAWKQIRRMSRGERSEFAQGLGIEGAESLVERLASRSGKVSPAVMMRALEFAKENDEAGIREVLRQLGTKQGRARLLEQGLDRLAAEDAFGDPVEPKNPVEAVEAKAAAESGPPQPIPEKPIVAKSVAAKQVPPKPVPAPPRPKAFDLDALRSEILDEARATTRLRLLRTALKKAPEFSSAQAQRLLEAFEPGWVRRRALDAMLRARKFHTVDEATASIATLESSASRRWCIGALLANWDLTQAQRDGLLSWRAGAVQAG